MKDAVQDPKAVITTSSFPVVIPGSGTSQGWAIEGERRNTISASTHREPFQEQHNCIYNARSML